MTIKAIAEDEIEEFVNAHEIAFIDFTATWCGPCKMMAQVFHQVDEKYDQELGIGKLDIDENPGIANALQVQAVPTLMVFYQGKRLVFQTPDGKQKDRLMGVQPKELIVKLVDNLRDNPQFEDGPEAKE